MNTGTSETALSAARVALLAGVSATALSISTGAAQAQSTVTANGVTNNSFVVTNTSGQLFGSTGTQAITGLTFNSTSTATQQIVATNPNGTSLLNGGGAQYFTPGSTQLAGFGAQITPLSGGGGTTGLATLDLTTKNEVTITPNEGVQVGNTSSGPAISLNPNGNISATGNYTTTNGNITTTNGTVSGKTISAGSGGLTSAGLITGNNGLTITSGTTNLQNTNVNGNLAVTGGLNLGGALTTHGLTNIGPLNQSGGQTTISWAGGNTDGVASLSDNGSNAALLVSNGSVINNGLKVFGGAVVNNSFTANGGSTLNGGATVNGLLTANNGESVTGTATLNGTGANAGTKTTINGAVATLSGSQGTISLNANVDPLVTISNTAGTSFTRVNNGFVNVVGGPTANTGNVNTLTSSNAAVNVTGGAVINNGLEVNQGLRVTGPSQGQGYQTIDMGGNRVQDVGTPIFGTDAANKAYVDRGLNKAYEGTAIALAISQPILGSNQSFAIRAGWGTYESENAFGLSAAGIIGRDWFWNGSTLALDAGVGWGSNNSVAGKAGVTFAFGGGAPAALPLK